MGHHFFSKSKAGTFDYCSLHTATCCSGDNAAISSELSQTKRLL